VKNVPESNGRVGMIGSSYDGWTVVMALLNPHPALKVAAPLSPMVDGWMGDDWFHHGAFRQSNLDYYTGQMAQAGEGAHIPRPGYDDYDNFLRMGSAGAMAHYGGLDPFPFWQRLSSHPSYDAFWSGQALDRAMVDAMKKGAAKVPTLWVQGLWDQEDVYGAIHVWEELTKAGYGDNNHLVMGPWRHSQVLADAAKLGALNWTGDTATLFRRDTLVPFFDAYLKDAPAQPMPAALIYNTAEDHWDRFAHWPGATTLKPLYLAADAGLAFDKPVPGDDSYVSDPAKPVPFVPRPAHFEDRDQWTPWLVEDQRFTSDRTDVLTYETPVLTKPVRVEGVPYAQLFAKTTGTDADWVVKIIDVFPGEMPETPKMGGYQLAVSLDIFRGRYRTSFEKPQPIVADAVAEYRFRLPAVDHVFEPGHRIMVQIQSSLFPLYDRNPQTFVPNIFFAKPDDYRKATMTVERGGDQASAVLLPVVETSTAVR
jgi:putative CocE/NonD family hydrolase